MKTFTSFIVVAMLAAPLAGCIVRSDRHHHRNQPSARRGNGCGPAHYWNGYKCVHNGRGRR